MGGSEEGAFSHETMLNGSALQGALLIHVGYLGCGNAANPRPAQQVCSMGRRLASYFLHFTTTTLASISLSMVHGSLKLHLLFHRTTSELTGSALFIRCWRCRVSSKNTLFSSFPFSLLLFCLVPLTHPHIHPSSSPYHRLLLLQLSYYYYLPPTFPQLLLQPLSNPLIPLLPFRLAIGA